jgi:hypothetical protein
LNPCDWTVLTTESVDSGLVRDSMRCQDEVPI